MRWIHCIFTHSTRNVDRFFLFFLCLFLQVVLGNSSSAQDQQNQVNQDSVAYYLNIVDQGEQQVGEALAQIGFLYVKSGRYNTALRYFDQALPLLNGERKSLQAGKVYQQKGAIYEIFGDNAQPTRYYRLAENQFNLAAENFSQVGDNTGLLMTFKNLANISVKRRRFASAVSYQNRVIELLEEKYQDSIQLQAESFNELLNQELESSKDTIFIERNNALLGPPGNVPWWDWRHWLLVASLLLLIALFIQNQTYKKRLQERELLTMQSQGIKAQLERKIKDLQTVNLALSKTEKEQRNANLTKDRIFSIISHDLRSPINTISGFLNILGVKLKSIGDIELKALTQEMEESTERLSRFLDDLLRWSMSQMGKLEANPVQLDMPKLVNENYLLVESRLSSKNIQFKTDIDAEASPYADVNMINLVLRNLISNAIKFTRQGGYIAVGVKAVDNQWIELSVADDGIGIAKEDLDRLFEFDSSTINGVPEQKGAGLGLILCKEFVELNGGKIAAESTVGEGTRFSILLPRN